jgi:hypothetical protein
MIAKVFLIGLIAVVMRLSSASAGYFDGNKLNWWCSNPDGSPPQAGVMVTSPGSLTRTVDLPAELTACRPKSSLRNWLTA